MSKLDKYLRMDMMPNFTCPGCTHGVAWTAMVRAIDNLKLVQSQTIMTCAIGCAGRLPIYLNFPSIRTPHGRALTIAQGIKLANPKLNVLCFMGDGDAVAIGGNHFIHACRRNVNLTAIVANNEIYGMTGGQYAPTMAEGYFASTAPYGMIEQASDICKLAIGAGATFVARADVYRVMKLDQIIEKAIAHKGFSVVEILTTCPTHFGRRNKMSATVDLVKRLNEITITPRQAERLSPEELKGKLVRGILREVELREYIEHYDEVTGFQEAEDKKYSGVGEFSEVGAMK